MNGGRPRRSRVALVWARDEVPVQADQDARASEPEPADTGREAEDVGGVVQGVVLR
jgi:hypothetical protein